MTRANFFNTLLVCTVCLQCFNCGMAVYHALNLPLEERINQAVKRRCP